MKIAKSSQRQDQEIVTMTALEHRLEAWHRQRFARVVSAGETLDKLLEEVQELVDALGLGNWKHAREEAADCAIVLFHLVRLMGGHSLLDEVAKKQTILEQRLLKGEEAKHAHQT
jgi:NTP pyrophosphatase (non-canonical NTP hydrolase)